jgi:hypothetical protein
MARTAAAHIHYVLTGEQVEPNGDGTRVVFRDYNVEVRQGQTRRTIGRIAGSMTLSRSGNTSRATWNALPIGATAWTRYHTTRAAALDALLVREDFRVPESHVPDGGLSRLRRAMVLATVRHPVPPVTMLPQAA